MCILRWFSIAILHITLIQANKKETRWQGTTYNRKLQAPVIVGFNLINSITDISIKSLVNGETVALDSYGLTLPNTNIQAETVGIGIGSVRFGLNNNANFRNEDDIPYSLCGVELGNYNECVQLTLGSHNVTATIYSGRNGTGNELVTQSLVFTIVQSSVPVYVPTPVPVPIPILLQPPSQAPTLNPVSVAPTPEFFSLNGTWELYNTSGVVARHECCFFMFGQKAYLMGGRETKEIDIFDAVTRTWSKGLTAPVKLHHLQCVEVAGKVYFTTAWTGGFPKEKNLAVMHVYDIYQNAWSTLPAMPEPRRRGSAAVVVQGSKIWVSHGNRGGHETGNFSTSYGWIDYYDTVDGTWHTGDVEGFPDAPNPRDHTGGGLVNGRICVAAGRNGGERKWPIVKETDCFDPVTKSWNDPPPPNHPDPRGGSSYGTSCDGRLIVAGGERLVSSKVHIFDGTSWTMFQNGLVRSRHGTGVAVDCISNLIYIVAGSGGKGTGLTKTLEIYNPAFNIYLN